MNKNNNNPIVTIGIPVMPDREWYMDKCLNSVISQTFSDPYQIIIAQHPGFSYKIKATNIPQNISIGLINSGVSLSSKRNDIIVHAAGKYIINIDDDVVPEHDWLEHMVCAAIENDYDIFWGLAKPIYEKEFPDDLDPFEMLIGGFHYDRKGKLRRRGLIGCNFGFKKDLNHKRGRFVESIGRGGGAVQDGEESLFIAECLNPKMGLIIDGVVSHYVQPERINFDYIIKNRSSNVKAAIFINNILGQSNYAFLVDRIIYFIRAFKPKKYMFKTIKLEFYLLRATIISISSLILKKVNI